MAIRTSFGTNLDFPNNILHYDLLAIHCIMIL